VSFSGIGPDRRTSLDANNDEAGETWLSCEDEARVAISDDDEARGAALAARTARTSVGPTIHENEPHPTEAAGAGLAGRASSQRWSGDGGLPGALDNV
jgi:hypothetical protein